VDQSEAHPWSIVLKAVRAPIQDTDPTYWNYHRREILAYREGLLDDLPGGLYAPRCLGLSEYADSVCWLWLEDVAASMDGAWSLVDYGMAARHLGRFNGAYLTGRPLPSLPWLSRNWLRGWLTAYDRGCRQTLDLVRDEQFWDHPLLRSAFPRPISDNVLRLWENHESLLSLLSQLPQTFCHMDAYRPNLFIRRDAQGNERTAAIDWVFTGTGGVGEEIANLFAASLMWLEYDASDVRRLDEAVFTGYVLGLREAGWDRDDRLARLGYTAACALRWGIVGLWWLGALNDARERAEFERHWKRPMPELVSQWAQTIYHVLDLAEEAYQLRQMLF
jgi:hypothetical protein